MKSDEQEEMIEVNLNASKLMNDFNCKENNKYGKKNLNECSSEHFGCDNNSQERDAVAILSLKNDVNEQNNDLNIQINSNISCLRQLYCPVCNQRLEIEKRTCFKRFILRCVSIIPIKCVCGRCVKRKKQQKLICNQCGNQLGYVKYS